MDEPTPSPAIPEYVADGVSRQNEEVLVDIIQYCEELIEYYNRDIEVEEIQDSNDEIVDVEEDTDGEGMIVVKKQQCGKDCGGCPHGPYKWRVTPADGGGKNWEVIERVSE